ncbi:MAG: 30S ribosomal protein S9 [Candidatus Eisenbacteria bacterium]|nr:30S ribosomal protein S9 [Candidatus Eisenbacteria bacterium]
MVHKQALQATGRRKTAVARVRLLPGNGKFMVNGKPIKDYFGREGLVIAAISPMRSTETEARYDMLANVDGGGETGQAGALRLAIARALKAADPANKAALDRDGHLTRDPRMKERKKYGQPGARKRFQFSKR